MLDRVERWLQVLTLQDGKIAHIMGRMSGGLLGFRLDL